MSGVPTRSHPRVAKVYVDEELTTWDLRPIPLLGDTRQAKANPDGGGCRSSSELPPNFRLSGGRHECNDGFLPYKELRSMTFRTPFVKVRKGFTLVELAVVVVIIGVLAAFGVPRFLQSVERSKAAEAFAYLSAVRTAQERYLAREGTYAVSVTSLDIQSSAPKYFTVPTTFSAAAATVGSTNTVSLENSWTLTLTRVGASGGYGAYTVTFTDQGYDSAGSTIKTDISPLSTTPS